MSMSNIPQAFRYVNPGPLPMGQQPSLAFSHQCFDRLVTLCLNDSDICAEVHERRNISIIQNPFGPCEKPNEMYEERIFACEHNILPIPHYSSSST